jgi:hypothetical protein
MQRRWRVSESRFGAALEMTFPRKLGMAARRTLFDREVLAAAQADGAAEWEEFD